MFYFDLAYGLKKTVFELLEEMDSLEISYWRAWCHIRGPISPEREDLRSGILAATVANVNRKPSTPAHKPSEFMPRWDVEPEPELSDEESFAQLKRIFGGKKR